MGWFRHAPARKGRHRIDGNMGGYYPEWERKQLPGYGSAQMFAYETLSLAPRNASNGFAVPMASMVTQPPQLEHSQQVRLDGYGLPAGTMQLQPLLYDPASNLGSTR